MRIKTYHGADLNAALGRARQELGPNALVLATNEVRGRMGLTSVEITVAIDREAEPRTQRELRRIANQVRGLSQGVDDADGGGGVDLGLYEPPRGGARKEELPRARGGERSSGNTGQSPVGDSPLDAAAKALARSGLSDDLVERFARIAARELPARGGGNQLAVAAERGIAELLSFEPMGPRHGMLFLVGPPGSGKTTTTAKLAARMALRGRGRVVLAQADTERVGADDQARIFCRHLGAEFASVGHADELRKLAAGLDRDDTLLVDTPGIGASDGGRLQHVGGLARALPHARIALLVPSGLHHDEARLVIDRFGAVQPDCIGFSKVDDGGRIGDLVTALAPTRLPLAFVTDGHRIPDDLHDASPRSLAALMLRSGYRKQAIQQESVR